jgi:hypothetical protein
MLKMKNAPLLFGLLLAAFAGTGAGATMSENFEINPSYRPNFINNEPYVFKGDMYTFISHAVGEWDKQGVTKPGVQKLIEFSKRHMITSFGVVSKYGGDGPQFYRPNQVSFIMESDAGQHKFKFATAKSFLIGGGNLSLCLCELLRDLIRGADAASPRPLNLFLVSDAIYDDHVYLPYGINPKTYPKFTLSDMMRQPRMTDEILRKYIERHVIGRDDQNFCPGQNFFHFPPVDKASVTFQIYRNGRFVGAVGTGTDVTVNLIVTETADLEKTIREMGSETAYPSEFP